MGADVTLPEGFVVDQQDERLSLQDDLARAADRATAAKRNPAKDPEVRALQTKLEGMPLFGKAPTLPDGFVVDAPKPEAKDDGNPILDTINVANKAAGYLNPANLLTDEEKQQVLHDNPVATAYRFIASKAKIAGAVNALRAPDEDGVTPIEREIQRRKEAGESIAPRDIEQWVDQQAKKNVFGETPPSPPVTEQLKQLYQQAVNDPRKFARSFIVGSIAHPEYLMLGPIGGLMAIAGENMMKQQSEHGQVDANDLMAEVAAAGVPVLSFHAAVRLANLRAAKTTGAEPTAKVEEQALAAINEKTKEGISEGQAPQAAATAALDDVLAVMKIAPEERAAIVKGVDDAIGEGQKPQGEPWQGAEKFKDFLGGVVKREVMESRGHEILDDMEEAGISPASVGEKFWSDTYYKLPAQVQQRFAKLLERQGGPEPSKAREWLDLPESAADLEGTERGFVALMKEANDRAAGGTETAARAPEPARLSAPIKPRASFGPAELIPEMPPARNVRFVDDEHGITPQEAKANEELQRLQSEPDVEKPAPIKLGEIKSEIGWAETGGSIIRDPRTGEVTGRTQWIPKSEFWGDRPGPTKISEKDAHAAIDKADAGEKLTPKEQRFVDYAKSELEKRNRIELDAQREAREERLGIQQYGRADPKLLAALGIAGVGAAYGYWLNKDPADAVRGALIAGGVAAGGLALGKVGAATGKLFEGIKDARYRIGHLTDDYAGQLRLGEWGTYRLQKALEAMVPDVKRREAITHAYQAGDIASLSPVEQKYVDVMARAFEQGAEMSKATGTPIQNLLENYITQFWVKGLNTKESLLENLKRAMDASGQTSPGMSPNTRFAKQRVIPNYKAGIEAGMVPVTLDSAAILRMYLDNINKAVQNKKLIDAMGRESDPLGRPVKINGDVLESMIKQRVGREMDATPLDDPAKKMVADIEAIKSTDDYTFINHPQMRNAMVLRDVAPSVKALFDSNDANAATRAAYAVSIAAKRGLFSFSLFHAKSLLDALLGTSPAGWAKVPGALKMLREGENAGLRDLIQGGLNVVTRPLEADASAFANGMRVLEAKLPLAALPIKGVRWVQEHMDNFLWGVVHPSFKIAAALAAYEKQIVKRPSVPREQIAKDVASYANDIFGGLDWFKIADGVQNRYGRDLALALASPSGRRFMQIAMLAPDWTVATTRAMAKAIPGVSSPEIAAMHRGYVLRSGLVYLMVAEGLNQAFSGHHLWENKDPTMVDMGDGRRMQLSKHFMEPVHWLTKPGQQLLNKLGYVIKEPMTQALHTEYLSTTGSPPMENRALHAIKGMLPIPATVMAQQGAGPSLSGMFGVPIYGKTQDQAVDDAIERALNLRQKRLDSDDPAEQAKARKKSQSETAAAAKSRVNRQYEKQREQQRARESR